MGTRLAAITTAAAIGLGGLAVAAVNPLGIAGAQDPGAEAPASPAADREGPLQRALDALVADGTLTEAQASTVAEAVRAEAADGREDRKERRADRRAAVLDAAATAIGSTPEDVRAGLRAGTSIAGQAEAAGVDRQVVDDALTALLTERVEAAVGSGTLTEEQGAKAEAKLDAVVDRLLDADGSHRGEGGGPLRDRLRERRGD